MHALPSYNAVDGNSKYRSSCQKSDVITSSKRNYLTNVILPRAIAYYTDHLRVVPISGPLKVSRNCRYTIDGSPCCATHDQCAYDSPNVCVQASVPSSHDSPGVSGDDFVLCVSRLILWSL